MSIYERINTIGLPSWKVFVAIAIILFSIFLGYSYEKSKFDAYKKEVEITGKVAEELTKIKEEKQKKVSEEITKGYANAVTQLKSHYASNRVYNHSSSSKMPNNAQTSPGVNAETESIIPSSRDIEVDCASDILQLLYLQQWIKEVQ